MRSPALSVPTVFRNHARLLIVLGLSCALLAFAAPRVFAVGGGIAESLGLRDDNDNVRARLGAQDDGKYGLRVWEADGSLAYDLTPGAGSIGQPRVGASVTALGTGMNDGETGYLRLGTGSMESVPVVWDDSRSKWVSTPQALAAVHKSVTTTSTTYEKVLSSDSVRHPVIALKSLYDAGMRPEVYVESYMQAAGGGSVRVEGGIAEIANGGVASSMVATGGEVSTTTSGPNSVVAFSDWTPMAISTAPTQNYGFGMLLMRVTSGTGSLTGGTISAQVRWAG